MLILPPMKSTCVRVAMFSVAALAMSACVSSDVLESASSTSASQTAMASPEEMANSQTATTSEDLTVAPADDADTSQIMAVAEPVPAQETSSAVSEAQIVTTEPQPAQSVESTTQLAALAPAGTPPVAQSQLDTLNDPNADLPQAVEIPAANAPRKTYLINGLLSAVPFIGYGFRNLNKKMPEARLYSYMGVVEGPAVIAPQIIRDAEAAYRKDPTTKINLIGISLGADLITVIAERLNEKNVPVNYLGIVDGTNLRPITPNVRTADNLTCSYLDCTRARARLAPGNRTTQLTRKVYKSSHIPLGNHDGLHAHVIARSQ